MMLTLSREQMLSTWRLARYHEPVNDGLAVETESTGVEMDRLDSLAMRSWYLGLLDRGPLEWLPVKDLSREAALTIEADGSGVVRLPPECRRVVAVELTGWARPARIASPDERTLIALQRSRLTRGGVNRPVAVIEPGGVLRLYTPAEGSRLSKLMCVTDPGETLYELDEAALSTITE